MRSADNRGVDNRGLTVLHISWAYQVLAQETADNRVPRIYRGPTVPCFVPALIHIPCRKPRAIRLQYNAWRNNCKQLGPNSQRPNEGGKPKRSMTFTNLVTSVISDDAGPKTKSLFEEPITLGVANSIDDYIANFDLDLNLNFDIPGFLSQTEMYPYDNLSHYINPCTNDTHSLNSSYLSTTRYDSDNGSMGTENYDKPPDTSSLNTLAQAATQYYPHVPTSHHMAQYNTSQYGNAYPDTFNPHSQTPMCTSADVIPYQAQVIPPGQYSTDAPTYPNISNISQPSSEPYGPSAEHSNSYSIMSSEGNYAVSGSYIEDVTAPKGPAFYPPTRLQYSYSTDHPTPKPQLRSCVLDDKPKKPHATPHKAKVSEIEIDRKRRRVMKERIEKLQSVLSSEKIQGKPTQACVLNAAANHISSTRECMKELETDIFRLKADILKTKEVIRFHQRQIPENGLLASCNSSTIVESRYRDFLVEQKQINPAISFYSRLIEPLFISFNSMVDNTSLDNFCKSTHQWFAQNCSLERLRELAMNLLLTDTSSSLPFAEDGNVGDDAASSSKRYNQKR